LADWQHKLNQLPCRKCPFNAEHRAHYAEVRELQARIRASEQDAERAGKYRADARALAVCGDSAPRGAVPTTKGCRLSYLRRNSLIITQAMRRLLGS